MHPPSTLLLRSLRSSISKSISTSSQPSYASLKPKISRCLLKPTPAGVRTYTSDKSNPDPNVRTQPRSRRTTLSSADLKPKSNYRGPPPEGTDAQHMTDLNSLNILSGAAVPATAIDACHHDGFQLNNGVRIADGNGCLLVDGEAFVWKPWEAAAGKERSFVNEKGQWEVPEGAWGALRLLWPKPGMC